MGLPEKKQLKAEAKRAKKEAKAAAKRAEAEAAARATVAAAKGAEAQAAVPKAPAPSAAADRGASPGVRFADIVRGALYLLLGASLAIALLLGQRGAIISLEEVIDSLFAAWAGKIVLGVIAIALVIYGLKHLRIVH